MASAEVKMTGPLFSGAADRAARDFAMDATRDIGDRGAELVQQALDGVLRHPTGYYRAHVRSNFQRESALITDSNVVYGPWLEGEGSRNATSRFKGYHTFRRTTQQIDQMAGRMAASMLPRYVARMN